MKRVVKQKYHIKSLLDFAEARACPSSALRMHAVRLLSPVRASQARPTSGAW